MSPSLCQQRVQVPEVHGYALSQLKSDFQLMFGREMDRRGLGGTAASKVSEIVFQHARDIATVVITNSSSAVLLPRPGHTFAGGRRAPDKIAPIRPRPDSAAAAPAGSVVALRTEARAAPQKPENVSGGAAEAPPSAAATAAAAPTKPRATSESGSSLVLWQRALVKHIKRRVLMTRFRLNQEAYRRRVATAGASTTPQQQADQAAAKQVAESKYGIRRNQIQSMVAVKSNLIRYGLFCWRFELFEAPCDRGMKDVWHWADLTHCDIGRNLTPASAAPLAQGDQ